MGKYHCTTVWLSKMQDQTSLMLEWCSILGGGSDIISSIFAHKGGQYYDYGLKPLHSAVIIHDARQKIVQAPLTLNSSIVQWVCRCPVYLYRQPILPLAKDVTTQPFDCQEDKTHNHWRSVDTHLKDILQLIRCSTIIPIMHNTIIDSHYIILCYNHLHPKVSRPIYLWSTAIYVVWAMNDIGPL